MKKPLLLFLVILSTNVLTEAFLWRHLYASRHNGKKHNVTTSENTPLKFVSEEKSVENTGEARAKKEEPKIIGESNSEQRSFLNLSIISETFKIQDTFANLNSQEKKKYFA